MRTYRKTNPQAPQGYFRWEAAGLRWLQDAHVLPVVDVIAVTEDYLELQYLTEIGASQDAAQQFGEGLALLHRTGAAAFGAPPPQWEQSAGFFGPLQEPLELSLQQHENWGSFWEHERMTPITQLCRDRGIFDTTQTGEIDSLISRVAAGDFDTGDPPARIHGDLWSGNIMWTDAGGVLIDPSAHGGHREYDLAMLQLFGAPCLETILAAYDSTWPLTDGWRDRVALHQFHALAVHAVLFGRGYAAQTLAAVRQYR